MGVFDNILGGALKGVAGQIEAAALPTLISAALSKTSLGDLQGLVTKLEQGGLGKQVQSWLGDGQNLSVTAEQLRSALDNDQVKQIAAHFGLPVDRVLDLLAQYLPEIVDKASPGGTLRPTA